MTCGEFRHDPGRAIRHWIRFAIQRGAICLAFGVAADAHAAESASAPNPGRPNIVLILADDLGYGDLGCFGQKKVKTPHIDRLAREGTRFTSTYAGSPVCAPSRCVLLTGLHTGHARIRGNTPQVGGTPESFGEGGIRLSITASDRTFAETLQAAGYATAAAGKWGLAEPGTDGVPNRRGFETWLGYLNQNHAAYYYTDFLWRDESKLPLPGNAGGARGQYSNDMFTDFAIDFIRSHRSDPFLLYLPYTIPHMRFEVPDRGSYAEEPWPDEAKDYAAMITRLDSYVGRIDAALRELGLSENTLLVFSSDNGPAEKPWGDLFDSAGPLRGQKSTLYEGGIRVPTIVRWPGRIPAGRVSDQPWGFVDLFPTLASLTGVATPSGLDGRDVSAGWCGRGSDLEDRFLYWEFPRDRLWQAGRHGRWKALRLGRDQPVELYDLVADPGETRDLATTHPQVAAELAARMDREHTPSPHWPVH